MNKRFRNELTVKDAMGKVQSERVQRPLKEDAEHLELTTM